MDANGCEDERKGRRISLMGEQCWEAGRYPQHGGSSEAQEHFIMSKASVLISVLCLKSSYTINKVFQIPLLWYLNVVHSFVCYGLGRALQKQCVPNEKKVHTVQDLRGLSICVTGILE